MQVGDLVKDSEMPSSWGIIIEIDGLDVPSGLIATVSWFYHEYYGQHESYRYSDELVFLNKNT
jgi:hypothetical protein